MQSEADDPVWGPGVVPIILRNLCPGCKRLQLSTETEAFYPTDFKPEGPDDMAEGWCNGIGCMPGEQGVSGDSGAEHWSSPNGCHPDCPACAAEQVGPECEPGPEGPCGGPTWLHEPAAIVGTPLSQPNVIQALWDKSTISVPSEHVRGIAIPQLLRDHHMPGDETYPLIPPKSLIKADYAGIELRVAEARIGVDWAEGERPPVDLGRPEVTLTDKPGLAASFTRIAEEFRADCGAGERPGIHFPPTDLPEADRMLLLVLRAMSSMLTGPVSHGGLMGPCQHNCSGLCGKLHRLQPQPQVWVSCGVIRQFRELYAAYTAKGDRSIAELQRDMATSTELIRQNCIPADAEQLWQAEKQRVEAKQKKAAELVLMPKELTAENGAKALLSGEFFEEVEVVNPDFDPDCDDPDDEDYDEATAEPALITQRVPVTWTTIKRIYKMCVDGLSQPNLKENQ